MAMAARTRWPLLYEFIWMPDRSALGDYTDSRIVILRLFEEQLLNP